MANLFTDGLSNPKTAKSDKADRKFLTKILHLAPGKLSGRQVCSSASAGCLAACLNTAGRGKMNTVQLARIRKTQMWFDFRAEFKTQIIKELTAFVKRCEKLDCTAAIRMNGTSDILWETQFSKLFTMFPMVQFYDYTKHVKRCLPGYALPSNYHLTFSRSENNDAKCRQVLEGGLWNVVGVFDTKDFPSTHWGYETYSADEDDLRFLDPAGSHFGCLYAKGDAKKDESGFVIKLPVLT